MNERMDERYGLDTPQEREREATDLRKKYEALEKDRDSWKSTVESIALMAGMVASETWGVLDILTHVREMREENADLKQQVADGDLAFNHANEVVGKLQAQVARLSAPVSDAERKARNIYDTASIEEFNSIIASRTTPENEEDDPDACEGCDKPLREDEGHETEDMVMLCDECWQELLDDLGWHSEECPCDTCIVSRTTKEPK